VIEIKQFSETSKTSVLSFLWQGTNISMAWTFLPDGKRFLSVTVANASAVERITGLNTATWTILPEGEDRSAAGARTTLDGPVPVATPKSMADIPDGKP